MPKTSSNVIEPGTQAADFTLSDAYGNLQQTQSVGCNFKRTPGNEPSAFETSGSKAA